MWKSITILSLMLVMASCGSKKASAEKKETTNSKTINNSKKIELGKTKVVSYESLGNDMAAISLYLYENNSFKFNFKTIADPEEDQKPIRISEIGTYKTEGDWTTLTFYNPKVALAPIFDVNYGNKNEYEIIDDSNVKINTAKNSISLWGIVCEKL